MLRSIAILTLAAAGLAAAPVKVLIVDGQNNHQWQQTTPVLKKILLASGRFTVDVATTPPHGGAMSSFRPDFTSYAVVVLNYNGDPWSQEANGAFEKFVRNGGGLVSYHASDNAFPEWKEFQKMIAVGGWGGRTTAAFGPMIRFREGKAVLDSTSKRCGNHGARLPFQVTVRDPKHPVTKGLPLVWMHAGDELYDSLCGPAADFQLLGTAHSLPGNRGTNEEEPMLLTVRYGKGRIFHTALGHDVAAMECTGFISTFERGTEWAATGKVTLKVPADFPGPEEPRLRK
ncbi:MAG: ThuA domain-containing protein [Acidobacteria bacterium]|nr:ThuA domain-containing protein [Acidobacteriota bacterium]